MKRARRVAGSHAEFFPLCGRKYNAPTSRSTNCTGDGGGKAEPRAKETNA